MNKINFQRDVWAGQDFYSGGGKEELNDIANGRNIDWDNTDQLANVIWLFLTNDNMPESATINKEAFLHEVSAMLSSTKQHFKT